MYDILELVGPEVLFVSLAPRINSLKVASLSLPQILWKFHVLLPQVKEALGVVWRGKSSCAADKVETVGKCWLPVYKKRARERKE